MTRLERRRRARLAVAWRPVACGCSMAVLTALWGLVDAEVRAGEKLWPKVMTGGTLKVYGR
jgi:hypothetical protein